MQESEKASGPLVRTPSLPIVTLWCRVLLPLSPENMREGEEGHSQGGVFKGKPYPLWQGVPFVQCCSPSPLTPL